MEHSTGLNVSLYKYKKPYTSDQPRKSGLIIYIVACIILEFVNQTDSRENKSCFCHWSMSMYIGSQFVRPAKFTRFYHEKKQSRLHEDTKGHQGICA